MELLVFDIGKIMVQINRRYYGYACCISLYGTTLKADFTRNDVKNEQTHECKCKDARFCVSTKNPVYYIFFVIGNSNGTFLEKPKCTDKIQ